MRLLCVGFACVWLPAASLRGAEAPPKSAADSGTERPKATSGALPSIFAPKAPSKAPTRKAGSSSATPTRRAISPEMAAKLSAVAKEVAPAPTAPVAASDHTAAPTDAVQLEPFVVEEEKYPELKERDILTRKGKLDAALKRHPGLQLGPLSLGNGAVAQGMIEDEFRRQRLEEMRELSGLMKLGKEGVPRELGKVMDETRTGLARPRDEKLFPDREKR